MTVQQLCEFAREQLPGGWSLNVRFARDDEVAIWVDGPGGEAWPYRYEGMSIEDEILAIINWARGYHDLADVAFP